MYLNIKASLLEVTNKWQTATNRERFALSNHLKSCLVKILESRAIHIASNTLTDK